jgi:hypothetical protein
MIGRDRYWKRELKQIRRSLVFWRKVGRYVLSDYSEHKINRGFLLSAVIIRKISDAEMDAEAAYKKVDKDEENAGIISKVVSAGLEPMKKYVSEIQKIKVRVTRYSHVDEDKFFVNSRVFLDDYDTKNAIAGGILLRDACNQIIHSYVWGIVNSGKEMYGVLLASDQEKKDGMFLLTVEDWTNVIDEVIEKG